MIQSRRIKSLGVLLPFVLIALSCGTGAAPAGSGRAQSGAGTASSGPPQQLSPEGRAALQATISAGNIPELRWPNFSDYSKLITKFYDMYGYSLPWVRGMEPTPQAQQVIALLLQADQKGLSADDYDGPRWSARLAKLKPGRAEPSEADAEKFDVALTVCVMRYISDLHIGKVNPKHFDFGLDIETKKYDLPEFLKENVVDSPNVAATLVQVEPSFPGYQRTIDALHIYLELEKRAETGQLPAVKKTLGAGDTYAGVPLLTRILRLEGDLPASANVPADGTVYQAPLIDAVKSFQSRHGREPDGRLGAQTIADLNVPVSRRVRQIQLTLERWRWLPTTFHAPPIIANIPEFRLRAYDEHMNLAVTMNVVVGKAYNHDTPVFADTMQYLVFRPYWNVPYSIARSEMFPRLAKDPNYLQAKGFAVVDSRQNVVTAGAVTPEIFDQLKAGKLFVRQNAGPKNSLGLVKFIFPNSYNVYMHDTPEQVFFSRSRRDFSHGCIRLEKPTDLAAFVLRDTPGWNLERVRAAMTGNTPNQQVNLDHPIPVYIVYGTVVVPNDGLVHFYDDIYGHDKTLEQVLAQGYPYPAS